MDYLKRTGQERHKRPKIDQKARKLLAKDLEERP
jgi:hypothetical protein